MNRLFLIAIALLAAAPVFAQEPVGCDKFKWPVDRKRALLASSSQMASGAEMPKLLATTVTVALVPYVDAKLPVPASRAPRAGSYAGFINAPAVPNPGTHRVTLSAPAWIDVIQIWTYPAIDCIQQRELLRRYCQKRQVRACPRAIRRRAQRYNGGRADFCRDAGLNHLQVRRKNQCA